MWVLISLPFPSNQIKTRRRIMDPLYSPSSYHVIISSKLHQHGFWPWSLARATRILFHSNYDSLSSPRHHEWPLLCRGQCISFDPGILMNLGKSYLIPSSSSSWAPICKSPKHGCNPPLGIVCRHFVRPVCNFIRPRWPWIEYRNACSHLSQINHFIFGEWG